MYHWQVHKWAEQYNSKLLATDPRLRGWVYIIDEEGTVQIFRFAFVVKVEDYYCVFTEHHGFHTLHEDEVRVRYFKKEVDIPKISPKDYEWLQDISAS